MFNCRSFSYYYSIYEIINTINIKLYFGGFFVTKNYKREYRQLGRSLHPNTKEVCYFEKQIGLERNYDLMRLVESSTRDIGLLCLLEGQKSRTIRMSLKSKKVLKRMIGTNNYNSNNFNNLSIIVPILGYTSKMGYDEILCNRDQKA